MPDVQISIVRNLWECSQERVSIGIDKGSTLLFIQDHDWSVILILIWRWRLQKPETPEAGTPEVGTPEVGDYRSRGLKKPDCSKFFTRSSTSTYHPTSRVLVFDRGLGSAVSSGGPTSPREKPAGVPERVCRSSLSPTIISSWPAVIDVSPEVVSPYASFRWPRCLRTCRSKDKPCTSSHLLCIWGAFTLAALCFDEFSIVCFPNEVFKDRIHLLRT